MAVCNLCNKTIHCKKGSTTGLSRHLTHTGASSSSGGGITSRKRAREEADGDEALNNVGHDVAKMMAIDGFTTNQIAKRVEAC